MMVHTTQPGGRDTIKTQLWWGTTLPAVPCLQFVVVRVCGVRKSRDMSASFVGMYHQLEIYD